MSARPSDDAIIDCIRRHSSPATGPGDVHGAQSGSTIYSDHEAVAVAALRALFGGSPPVSPPPPTAAASPDEPRQPRRVPLPNRRGLVSLGFEHGGHTYHLGIGPYPDGRVGEIWIATAKASSELEATARDVAIAISVALQSGMTVETFRGSVQRRPDGGPASLLGTVLDLIVDEGFA